MVSPAQGVRGSIRGSSASACGIRRAPPIDPSLVSKGRAAGGGLAACSMLTGAGDRGEGDDDRVVVSQLKADILQLQQRLDRLRGGHAPGELNLESWLWKQENGGDALRHRLRLTEVYLVKALQLIEARSGSRDSRSDGPAGAWQGAWQLADPAEPGSAPATAPLRSLLAFADSAAPREGSAAGDAFFTRDEHSLGRRSGRDGIRERLEALERETREQRAKLDDAAKRNRVLEQELLQAKAAGVGGSKHVELELRREVQTLRGERAELENKLADVRQRQATSGAGEEEVRELRRQLERVRDDASVLRSSLAKESLRAQRAEAKVQQAEAEDDFEDLQRPPTSGSRSRSWAKGGNLVKEAMKTQREFADRRGATPQGGARRASAPTTSAGNVARVLPRRGSAAATSRPGALTRLSPISARPPTAGSHEASCSHDSSCSRESAVNLSAESGISSFCFPSAPAPPLPNDEIGKSVAALLDEHYPSLSEEMRCEVGRAVRGECETLFSGCRDLLRGTEDVARRAETASKSTRDERREWRLQLAEKQQEAAEANAKVLSMKESFAVGVNLVSETRSRTDQITARMEERQARCGELERKLETARDELAEERRRYQKLSQIISVGGGKEQQQQIDELRRELDEAIDARLRLQSCLDTTDMQRENFDAFLMEELSSMRNAFAIKLRLASQEVQALKQSHRETLAKMEEESARETTGLRHRLREAEQRAAHLERRLHL
eukprot:Hpha_TRINITY_DN16865_c0_g7::TRINITY_DN16865_c0_g7_i1::g.150946::m.150946